MASLKRSEKEEFWRLAIGEQRASGLSARAFCSREGISESLFYSWRSKITDRDTKASGGDKLPQLIPVSVSNSAQAPCRFHESESERAAHQIEIQTPGGFKLRVSDRIAPNCLGRLLSVVAQVDVDLQLDSGADRC